MNYKIIGKGGDGIIVYPALIYEAFRDNTETYTEKLTDKKYISKIGTEKLINEKYIYDILPSEYDSKFYDKECHLFHYNLNKSIINNELIDTETAIPEFNTQIIIPFFKGDKLSFVLENVELTNHQSYNLLVKLIKLYDVIDILNNTYNIYHKDISTRNILYNVEKNKIRLIDYSRSRHPSKKSVPEYKNKDTNTMIEIINTVIIKINTSFKISIPSVQTIEDIKSNKSAIKMLLI